MKPLPLPLRVAAGLAVTTAEHVRDLPRQVTGLPVTVASQVLQFSMRVQQHLTELAIKGDSALSSFRPVEDTPSWATFDEDAEPDLGGASGPFGTVTPVDFSAAPSGATVPAPRSAANGHRTGAVPEENFTATDEGDPWSQEERALAEDHPEGTFDTGSSPAGLDNYDELTLPQLRARLRLFSLNELEELLAYEQAHQNRTSFTSMLVRRIGNVRKTLESSDDNDGAGTDGR